MAIRRIDHSHTDQIIEPKGETSLKILGRTDPLLSAMSDDPQPTNSPRNLINIRNHEDVLKDYVANIIRHTR